MGCWARGAITRYSNGDFCNGMSEPGERIFPWYSLLYHPDAAITQQGK
jgi:hypothetical protein